MGKAMGIGAAFLAVVVASWIWLLPTSHHKLPAAIGQGEPSDSAATGAGGFANVPARRASGVEPVSGVSVGASEAAISLQHQVPTFLNKRIHSEGYAPHIRAAYASDKPEQIEEAMAKLRLCKTVEQEIELMFSTQYATPDLIKEFQHESRACQTVQAEDYALEIPLLRKIAAVSPDSNLSYLRKQSADDPHKTEALRRAHQWAVKGHHMSMFHLARGDFGNDLDHTERRALAIVLRRMTPPDGDSPLRYAMREPIFQDRLEPPELEAQARVRSAAIWAVCCAQYNLP